MREIRLSGSEGGGDRLGLSLPLSNERRPASPTCLVGALPRCVSVVKSRLAVIPT